MFERIEAGRDRLGLDGLVELARDDAEPLDLLLVRAQLALDELAHRLHDELLLLGRREVDHRPRKTGSRLSATAARASR